MRASRPGSLSGYNYFSGIFQFPKKIWIIYDFDLDLLTLNLVTFDLDFCDV